MLENTQAKKTAEDVLESYSVPVESTRGLELLKAITNDPISTRFSTNLGRGLYFRQRYPGLSEETYNAVVAFYDFADSRCINDLTDIQDLSVPASTNNIGQSIVSKQPSGAKLDNGLKTLTFDGTDDFMAQKVLATASTGTFQLATVAAGAMIYCSALDLTPYIGKFIRVKDTGGKYAWGYIKAACGGETLDSDLFDAGAGVFTSGTYSWTPYGNNTIANDANTLKITYVDTATGAVETLSDANDLSADLVIGNLYKLVLDARVDSDLTTRIRVVAHGNIYSANLTTNFVSYSFYFIINNPGGTNVLLSGLDSGSCWFDNLVLKQVTDLPVTGVTIVSTLGGATQSWAGRESGFNPSAISTVEVLEPDFNITGSFTMIRWIKPSDGQPAADQFLGGKNDYTTPNYSYGLKLKTTGKLEAIVSSDGTTATGKITDAAVYADGAQDSFNMVAVVYDTAQTITFYNNEAPAASSNLGGGGPPASIKDMWRMFTIGMTPTPALPFAGSDALTIFVSRALSAAEIVNIYNRDKGRFEK